MKKVLHDCRYARDILNKTGVSVCVCMMNEVEVRQAHTSIARIGIDKTDTDRTND